MIPRSLEMLLAGLLIAEPLAMVTKATVILIAAGVLTLVLRRASAAIRHLVWVAALVGCAAIVVLTPIAPAIRLAVSSPAIASPRIRAPYLDNSEVISVAASPLRTVARALPVDVSSESVFETTNRPRVDLREYAPAVLLALWVLGALTVLVRCLAGHRAVASLLRHSVPLDSDSWRLSLGAAARAVGIDRDVPVAINEALTAPITVGLFRPAILLPSDASEWTLERRDVVLVHELAHAARGDYAAQLLATFTVAVFWFHPLVWLAAARLRLEAEHAADDRVLTSGTTGVAYATHLLEIASAASATPLLRAPAMIAVGMIRTSRLEGRFRAMLDPRRSRASISRRFSILVTIGVAAAIVPLAGVRAVLRAAPVPSYVDSPPPSTRTAAVPVPASATPARPRPIASDSILERTIDLASGSQLSLDLKTGASIVVHGWRQSRVHLSAELAGRDWRDVSVTLDRVGNGATLRSVFRSDGSSTALHFDLWVPEETDIDVHSAGGSIEIDDVGGRFTGSTGGGRILFQNASGYSSLTTGGGEIRIIDSNLDGAVSTGAGRVTTSKVTGNIRASTAGGYTIRAADGDTIASSGSRSFHVIGRRTDGVDFTRGVGHGSGACTSQIVSNAGGAHRLTEGAPLAIAKPGGAIEIGAAPTGANLSTGGGRIYVGSSNGRVIAGTGGGDVELRDVGGDALVSTGAGDVAISLTDADGSQHSVDVCDGHGTVIIEVPAQLDATFELETAYTDNFGRQTSITSEIPLEQSETHEWDDHFGTPRKFVRARGKVGAGGRLIRVSTVNGDVIVRRRSPDQRAPESAMHFKLGQIF